jgi:hypothetical protein
MSILKSPYPYFGGKRKIASMVWQRFGAVDNVVEPFFGSGAVLLARPEPFDGTETINDADGFVSNFWRSIKSKPDEVAFHADWPVSECDLHARHAWLVGRKDSMQELLEGDPDWFDTKIAGWWCWGLALWIGSGFCSGNGPWQLKEEPGDAGRGVKRKLVHVGDAGRGVNRQLVHVGNPGQGVNRQLVHVGNPGQGVNRQRERLSGFGETGVNAIGVEHKRPENAGPAGGSSPMADTDLGEYFAQLSNRLRRVRVCCGDWSRVVGPSVTYKHGLTGVFLDPPYADTAGRANNLYRKDCQQIAHAVAKWAIQEGKNPLMRIILCGYIGEHQMPDDWDCVAWNAGAGFGGQAKEGVKGNGKKERIWFSPNCDKALQGTLL